MVQDYRETGAPYISQWPDGIAAMDAKAEELRQQGLLPEQFVKPKSITTETTTSREAEDVLAKIRAEYNTGPHTPEFIQETWQEMLEAWVALAKEADPTLNIAVPTVPSCGRTQKQLEALRSRGEGRIYVPSFDYPIVAKIFPRMRNENVAKDHVQDDNPKSGIWLDFDMQIDAPYLKTTESDQRRMAKEQKRTVGQVLPYIWASQASKVFTNQYLDEGATWSLLPDSKVEGEVVSAYFYPDGHLYVHPCWGPGVPVRGRGGRLQRE